MVKFTVPFPVPLPGVTLVIQVAPLVGGPGAPGRRGDRNGGPGAAAGGH